MPIFLNPEEDYFLVTSFKVMYGTLCRQDHLRPLSKKVSLFVLACDRFFLRKRKKYLLVRCPYSRLVSFYAHKILSNRLQGNTRAPSGDDLRWQHCQKIFFSYLGLSTEQDDRTIGRRLADVSFERFARILPEVFELDPHLWPQSWACHLRWKRLRVMRLSFDKIIRIEDDIDFLQKELRIDLTIQANKTMHESYDEYFTPASYEIVNRLYRDDFRLFGYAPRSD